MTDNDRLKDKLAKLAAGAEVTGATGRRLSPGGSGLLGAILDEVDETILPRRLTFRNGSGEELVLDVAGRRLVGVVRTPTEDGTATGPIGEDAEGRISALREALSAFLDGEEELLVRTDTLEDRPEASAVGRSADALAQAFGVTSAPAEVATTPTFDAVIAGLEGACFVIYDEGTVSNSHGDQKMVGALSIEVIEALLSEAASNDGPAACILGGDQGDAVLVGRASEGTLVLASPGTGAAALAAAWIRVFG